MVSNRITEGVGKKIVEALKQQSDIEIQSVVENPVPPEEHTVSAENEVVYNEEEPIYNTAETEKDDVVNENVESETSMYENATSNFANQHVSSYTHQSSIPNMMERDSFATELDGFEVPTNIAVLKQLINQLPAGVSKQTGALIIKQTMEALGISMKSVLQEAQQVQESLNNSSRECQASIMEYKKQIGVLEKQSQKFQRQCSALNDIISLFVQTSL